MTTHTAPNVARRLIALTIATCALLVGSIAPQAAAVGRESNPLEAELLQQMNAERAARGIDPLVLEDSLNLSSLDWANGISSKTNLIHSGQGTAEIIAYGYSTGQITRAWMNSPGHRHLMTDPNLGFAGVGAVCDSSGRIWAVIQFHRIDDTLATQSSSPPSPVISTDSQGSDCDGRLGSASVRRLYMAFFLRESDASGLAYWGAQEAGGLTLAGIADYFSQSPEFQNSYGSLSDREFVTRVYGNVMGRTPDEGGYAYWVGRMQNGLSRGELMVGFSESAEFAVASGIS